MTRVEAEKQAKELNKTDPKWYCPLIRDTCNKLCVNFTMAFVDEIEPKSKSKSKGMLHDIKDDNFIVEGFVCSNAQFLGSFVCGA